MENVTCTIDINEIIAWFNRGQSAKIEFYKDGTYVIKDCFDFSYPGEPAQTEYLDIEDFEECGKDVDAYAKWLEGWLGFKFDLFTRCDSFNEYTHVLFLIKKHEEN